MFTLLLIMMLGTGKEGLVGTWELVPEKDAGDVEKETLYFYEDGRLIVDGPTNYKGKYQLEGEKLIMTMSMVGSEMKTEGLLELKGDRLTLIQKAKPDPHAHHGHSHGNDHAGQDRHVVYQRKKGTLPKWDEKSWLDVSTPYFKFKVPFLWQVHKEKPGPKGNQRVILQDPAGPAVTLLRIPGRGEAVDLPKALMGVMMPTLHRFEIDVQSVDEKEGEFFGRKGYQLSAKTELGGTEVHVVTYGHKLESDTYLVALLTFEKGGDEKLKKIMGELEVK